MGSHSPFGCCLYLESVSTHASEVCSDELLAFGRGFVMVALVLEEAVVAGRLGLGARTTSTKQRQTQLRKIYARLCARFEALGIERVLLRVCGVERRRTLPPR